MTCRLISISLLLIIGTPGMRAENRTPSIEVSTGTTDDEPGLGLDHSLSPNLSRAVSAGIKYNPPPPPKAEEDQVDLRDVDKPRNQIIRLPRYVVEAKRAPVFNERNLYSREMLRRLAYRKYISSFSRDVLNRFRLPIIGGGIDAYANMMYEAEERERNMAEIDDRVSMYRLTGDKAEAAGLKDDADRTFMRRSDFGLPVSAQP